MDITKIPDKINSIEILRVIFTFAIIMFHIFVFIDPKQEVFIYCRRSFFAVDFFFIIAGFFLCGSFAQNFKTWIIKRFSRLFPAFFAITIICAIYTHPPFYSLLMDFSLLSGIGIFEKAPLCVYCWYILPLFWVSCLYCCVSNIIKNKFNFLFFVSILVYFSFVILFCKDMCVTGHVKNVLYIFNIGCLRAITGIGIGILVRMLFYNPNIKLKQFSRILFTGLELFLFSYLMAQFFFVPANHTINYNLGYIIIFTSLFLLLVNNYGYFSFILNKFNINGISKYCYCWYIAQEIPPRILSVTLPYGEYITYSLLTTILAGIILYHLVEKPFRVLLEKSRRGGNSLY